MSVRYNLDDLKKQINSIFLEKDFFKNLYFSITGITGIVKAIHQTNGDNWTAHAIYDDGTLLFPTIEQQQRFTEIFQPYIIPIISFLKADRIQGGAEEPGEPVVPIVPVVPVVPGNQVVPVVPGNSQTPPKCVPEPEKDTVIGPDEIFSKAVHTINNINSSAHEFANKYGILHYQREYEKDGDVPMIPEALVTAISGLTGPSALATRAFLSNIKLPIRTIVFLIHVALETARISISVTGSEYGRKILSVIVSLVELLKGDWKQALLTFIGYYGMTPLLVGQAIKIFMYLFELLSPHLRENIIYGTISVPKSLLIGILLTIFKITAPFEIRTSVMESFEKIRMANMKINKVLEETGVEPRSDYFSPTFDDLNNLQSLISGDQAYICSCEFEKFIEPLRKSSIVYIIVELLGIPISEDFRRVTCGDKCKPFLNKILTQGTPQTSAETITPSAPVEQPVPSAPPVPPVIPSAPPAESAPPGNPLPPVIPSAPPAESVIPLPPVIPSAPPAESAPPGNPVPPLIPRKMPTKQGGRRLRYSKKIKK